MPPTSVIDHTASLVFYFFNQLSRHPRPSRKEEAVRNFVIRWAESNSYRTVIDRTGNCIITVPAATNKQQSPPLALQAHFDMVCETTPGHKHNFLKDPITPRYEDDWVRANNTTLGADNGIGIALAMALCEDPMVTQPQLELIFTVDEETGLTGAAQLQKKSINTEYLLNLDSEDDQVLINGCAGGVNVQICKSHQLEPRKHPPLPSPAAYTLQISNFPGGTPASTSTNRLATRSAAPQRSSAHCLQGYPDQCLPRAISGGTVHNAIPRDCAVELLLPAGTTRNRAERIARDALKQYATRHGIKGDMSATLLPSEKTPPRSHQGEQRVTR